MKNFIIFLAITLIFTNCKSQNSDIQNTTNKSTNIQKYTIMHFNILTPEEQKVILYKGTERPFVGKYDSIFYTGTYLCKQCNAPLYLSRDKFDAHCGWPSFDDEIHGAINRQIDADGNRTEIICANCGAHLGHVFEGEGLTPKNERHCVNSISLNFIPVVIDHPMKLERAIYAGGCFWGVEYYLQKEKGVISTTCGYIGGNKSNPSYEEVCSHTTGFAEAVEVYFNPDSINFEQLTRYFFDIHDPTQLNRQGPDVGDQYRSEIFYCNDNQKQIAQKLIDTLKSKGFDVKTLLTPANVPFYPAELYHQDYYLHKGTTPYCHVFKKRI